MIQEPLASRSVLSDQVKDRLLQGILAGRYTPGDRIVETRLARELGTSQAPVREALRDLEALGVVEITAFRGARVRRPSADELLEAFVVRAELESLGVRLALPHLTNAHVDELGQRVVEMYRASQAGDAYAEATADADFHRRIIEIAGNSTLERVWRTLEPFSRTYITLAVAGVYGEQMAGLHTQVLAALRDRDPERSVAAIRRHFRDAADMFGRVWSEEIPWIAEIDESEPLPRARKRPATGPDAQESTTGGRTPRRGRRS